MGAHKLAGRRLHHVFVQVPGVKPCTVDIKRVFQPGIVNLIGVFLPGAGADGVEILVNLKSFCHHDVAGKVGIQRIGQPLHRDGGGRAEIRHVHPRMNTRVRPAAARHMHRMPNHHGGGLLHSLRYGGQIFLHLPAVVMGAEISQKQGDIAHISLTYQTFSE